MKYKNLIFFLIIAFSTISFTYLPDCPVKFVYDGDTILLKTGKKVRYLGIDAPELDHKGGKNEFMAVESRNFNRRHVSGKRLIFEFDREKKDHYGRLLSYVFLENGDMVNALLVRAGLAHVMIKRPDLKYFSLLLNNQRLAMEERLGIWRKVPARQEDYYVGNKKSYRFHRPCCPFARKISPRHFLRFINRLDAFWEGFSPCKRCRP